MVLQGCKSTLQKADYLSLPQETYSVDIAIEYKLGQKYEFLCKLGWFLLR